MNADFEKKSHEEQIFFFFRHSPLTIPTGVCKITQVPIFVT